MGLEVLKRLIEAFLNRLAHAPLSPSTPDCGVQSWRRRWVRLSATARRRASRW